MTDVFEQILIEQAEIIKSNPQEAAALQASIDPIYWLYYAGLKTEKGDEIEFEGHKPLEQIYNEWHPHQVYMKGSQIGMTQASVNKLLWYGDNNKITAIYTMPTATDVYQFSQQRFAPIIKDSPYLKRRMGNVDNTMLKRIGTSWIYFRGTRKESQAISVPSDINVHDELDFSDANVRDTFSKRLGASKLAWEWDFSTPTIPKYGIHALYLESDQMHWLIKCKACGRWVNLMYPRNIRKKRGAKGHVFACHHCGKIVNRKNGMWVPKYPSKATDAVYDEKGRIVEPGTGIRGYWVNPLTFTFRSADYYIKAQRDAEISRRPIALKNFYNFDLGLPYQSGDALLTEEIIRSRILKMYDPSGYNVIGVDQGDLLYYVIKHVMHNGVAVNVKIGIVNSFEDIGRLIREWEIRSGVIDALPNKHPARKLVLNFPRKMYMAYYKENQRERHKRTKDNKKNEKNDDEMMWSRSEKETNAILIDRTEGLDASAQAWIDSRAFLLDSASDLETQNVFIRQMTGMSRDLREDEETGIVKAVWIKIGEDHFRHADSYAFIASTLRGRGSIKDLSTGGNIREFVVQHDSSFNISDLMRYRGI